MTACGVHGNAFHVRVTDVAAPCRKNFMYFLLPRPGAAPHPLMRWLTRMMAFVLLGLFATALRAEPLAVDYLCDRAELFDRGAVPADGWRHAADGKVLLPQGASCWIRAGAAIPAGQSLAFAASYADVEVFDAKGRLIAAGRHAGTRSNALLTSRHVFFPDMDDAEWRYARLSYFSRFNRTEPVTVERVDLSSAFQADQRFDHDNLAILVGLGAIAVFCALFGVALRDRDYALLVAWLGFYAAYKWGYGGFAYVLSNAPYASFYAVFPVVTLACAARQLVVARVGKFRLHSPLLNRLSWVTVMLFFLLIPIFYWRPDVMAKANAWILLVASFPLLLVGTWRGWRAGDKLCAMLFFGNLPLALYYAPILLANLTGNPAWARFSVHGSWLNYAADLLLPLLFCAGLAVRSRNLRREALHLATHDTLTGLPNRELMLQSGEQLAGQHRLAVLVLNIERFKAINETLGPQIGDRLLVQTASRLSALGVGQLSRLHADQFCLLVDDAGRLDAVRRQIEQAFAAPIEVNGQTVDLSLAVGVARDGAGAASGGPGMTQLLRNAEMALDHARAHRQGWAEYSSALESQQRADLGLLSELGRAVEQGELRMFLQPKVRIADGAVVSAEALIRWEHPERGLVPPAEFIPFAEQTGRIGQLTRWILRQAMTQTVQWRRAGRPLQISVNLSSCDLDEAGFPERLAALLAETGADPADIQLEITESGAMTDAGAALTVMAALRAIGFTLSIDDFGTGYSSLIYLQKMPVSELKIDRAFVNGITEKGDGSALLESIIQLGHQLGLCVVAEGAETAGEWRLLGELGCDYVQGWFAARPMPAEAFERWCAQHTPFLLTAPPHAAAHVPAHPCSINEA